MKSKRFFWVFLALLLVSSMVLGACGGKETEEPVVVEEEPTFLACQVTDMGGIDDQSFNQTAWKGIEDAIDAFGIEGKYLESQQQTDYEANINAFVEEGCDLIISVGFLMAEATGAAAEAYPDQKFAGVDIAGMDYPNFYGSDFAVNQASFLAGYMAAELSETGIVATFGGIQFPAVTWFMDGFVLGVEYYNEVKGTDVQALGWDPITQTGLFVGNFDSTDDGRTMGESLIDEGADIIMPVAGPVGAGTLTAIEDAGTGYLIGVDSDWSLTHTPAERILVSVMKNMDVYVKDTIEMTLNDEFAGGNFLGTLENGGVGLAYGGVDVPADLMAEIEDIKAGIIAGTIATLPVVEEAPADALGTETNPLIMAVVPSGETETVITGFEEITDAVLAATGLYIEPFVATEYAGVIEAMCSDPPKAHVASLATFSYLIASERGCAEVALVSTRYGSPYYNGQIFTKVDSGIETIADLEGKTFCRPDPLSTSGWVAPSIALRAAGLDPDTAFANVVDAGSHDASVAGVYNGDCDAGSSYVDARTNLEEDYPDVMDVIKVIEISPDIPNDGVQFVTGFDPVLKGQIVAALLALAETEEGADMLSVAYSWNALMEVDDTFYDPFRQYLDAAGVVLGE